MKKFLAVILVLTLALSLFACAKDEKATEAPEGGKDSGEEFVVDVFIYNFADTYVGTVRAALDKELKGMDNVKYEFYDGQLSQDTQSSQIDSAIARGTDLLVVNIVEPGSAEVLVNKAKEKDLTSNPI